MTVYLYLKSSEQRCPIKDFSDLNLRVFFSDLQNTMSLMNTPVSKDEQVSAMDSFCKKYLLFENKTEEEIFQYFLERAMKLGPTRYPLDLYNNGMSLYANTFEKSLQRCSPTEICSIVDM